MLDPDPPSEAAMVTQSHIVIFQTDAADSDLLVHSDIIHFPGQFDDALGLVMGDVVHR